MNNFQAKFFNYLQKYKKFIKQIHKLLNNRNKTWIIIKKIYNFSKIKHEKVQAHK